VVDAEGEDGVIVGARWLQATSDQQPADADQGKSLFWLCFGVTGGDIAETVNNRVG